MADGKLPPSVRAEALRLLGVSGAPQAELSAEMEGCYAELLRHSSPRTIYKIFDIRADCDTVEITPELRLRGAALAELCKDSRRAALLAATLGAGVDRLIARTQAVSVSRATILDACASAEIERLCDETEPTIMAEASRTAPAAVKGEVWLTMRFSPGYSGVEPAESAKIIDALNAGRAIGLSLTHSVMLVPIKSVTAIIGIADRPQKRYRSCAACAAAGACPYRKRGAYCGDRA
ncbi:MAG: hypothetical protein LUE09_00205 [Synergistaceae bacterium]|nr:hypothetical protein [Synergistaceae bacterium]